MSTCGLRWAAMLCVLGVALPVSAAEKKTSSSQPAVVIRVQSVDGLLKDFQELAKLAGEEEKAKQLEGLLKSRLGDKGLEGLDTKRPLGLYGDIGPNGTDSTFVGMIPVSDEMAVLSLLERMNFKAEKGTDGVYTIAQNNQLPVDVYFRFAHKYVYVTAQDKTAIDEKRLLAPETVLPAKDIGTASLTMRLDQIPEGLRNLGLQMFELQLSQAKDQKEPNETEAQHKLKVAMIDSFYKQVATVLNEGHEVNVRLDLNDANHDISVKASLSGKDGTSLAKNITALGQRKSLFAAIPGSSSVLSMLVHVSIPAGVRESMGALFDEGLSKSLAEEKDAQKREITQKLVKSLEPSLKSGDIDAVFDLSGPGSSKLYTLVMGLKLKDGANIDKTVRDAVKQAPEADRKKFTFDAEKAGSTSIHRVDIGDIDANAKKMLGSGPAYFAFRDDALLIAAGDNALAAIKKAITAQPQAGKPLQVVVSIARLAPLMAKDNPEAPKIAEKVFAGKKDADKITFTIEGGESLSVHFTLKKALVQFFAEMDKEKKGSK